MFDFFYSFVNTIDTKKNPMLDLVFNNIDSKMIVT
jgi:hypothetical protein